ncbi:MAG: hypothetical protein JNK82_19920 [Myxococcaceae bacterium]|nr:hypothetical protein [Myxococcaceae bacterium]
MRPALARPAKSPASPPSAPGTAQSRSRRFVLLAVCWVASSACPGEPAVVAPPPELTVKDHWSSVDVADAGPASLGPEPLGRRSRRLSVQQLEQTIITLTGDTWAVGPANPPIEVVPFLRTVLGQPDYLSEFRESLDIGPTFTKFMDNWASEVCASMVVRDLTQPNPALRRFVMRIPPASDAGTDNAAVRAAVEQNLRDAKLHLHGELVSPAETAAIEPYVEVWQQLYLRNLADPYPDAWAWAGVCTLMLTDPEFVTY